MCLGGQWADRGCLWDTITRTGLAQDAYGTLDEGKVAHLELALETQDLADDAHSTTDGGKVALLDNRQE